MKHKSTVFRRYEVPECEVFRLKIEADLCNNPSGTLGNVGEGDSGDDWLD